MASIRYGGVSFDPRRLFIRLCAWLQGKPVLILDSNPQACARVLEASEVKGTFIEHIFAIPAWAPVHSIESEDGPVWQELVASCKHVLKSLRWKERLPGIAEKQARSLAEALQCDDQRVVDAEAVSRLTMRILYELLFERSPEPADEALFYQASLEWRKEIALKGKGNVQTKRHFVARLRAIIEQSAHAEGLARHQDPVLWLSTFAQPFIISPQINVSDIMVAVFHYLRLQPNLYEQARVQARANNDIYLGAIVMEAIRLRHPFPVLERQLPHDLHIGDTQCPAGTQVFMMLDQFKQDPTFDPQRWLNTNAVNPYEGLPFGSGRRMCLGKSLATALLEQILKNVLLLFADAKIRPEAGHLYSGRNNDGKESLAASLYQLARFVGALITSFRLGRTLAAKQSTAKLTT